MRRNQPGRLIDVIRAPDVRHLSDLAAYVVAWRLLSDCARSSCLGSLTPDAPCLRTGRLDPIDCSPNLALPPCVAGANVLLALDRGIRLQLAVVRGGELLARDVLRSAGADTGDDAPIDVVHRLEIERGELRLHVIGAHRRSDVQAIQHRLKLSRGWSRGW